MKKTAAFLCACLLLAGLPACQKAPAAQGSGAPADSAAQSYVRRYPGEYSLGDYPDIEIRDAGGNDITPIVVDLWFAANEAYNVDDVDLFEQGEWVQLFEGDPDYVELKNYDAVIGGIFTANGRKQVEETSLGGQKPFIQKAGGKVYRLGPWRTGYSVAYSLHAMKAKEVSDRRVTVTATYELLGRPLDPEAAQDYVPEHGDVDLTLALENGVWRVDDYRYPEAR